MKDYSKFIEEQLNTLMPFSEIYEENKPIEYPVKDAPKVSGYFGFIGLKYMKRVRNIKKLCVEYINTYVDGSLNVANKIDKVDLIKNYKNLATEVGFKVSQGFSTQGNAQSSDNKEGVAFLTGDKAVMDKLNSIKSQIKTYASKSASLTEWASLMIDKSHMIACQIVKEKTDEMIDDKEKEKLQSEFDKKLAEANKKIEEEKKKTEELNKKFEKYGDYSQMNHDMYNLKDIADIAQTDYNNDMSLPLDDKKSKIYDIRRKFYTDPKSKWGLNDFSKYNEDIDKVLTSDVVTQKLEGISNDEQKEQAKNEVKNYALSVLLAKDADVKNKNQYLSPIDLQILRNNISAIGKATIEGSNRASEKMGSYRATPVFKVSKFKGDELNKIDVLNMDRNLLATIAGEWGYTFGECTMYQDKEEKTNEGSLYEIEIKNQINETKHYVMGWNEFLKEHLSKK